MPEIELNIRTDFLKMGDALGKVTKQIPYATAQALNDTVKAAQLSYRSALPTVFNSPTPFILNSSFTTPASKQSLSASLGIKNRTRRGMPATGYLEAEILGGERGEKPFEFKFGDLGVPAGMFAVPGPGATLDEHGNIPRIELDQIYRALAAGAARGRNVKIGGYFLGHFHSTGSIAVFRLVARGRVLPVIVFTRKDPAYAQRLDFYGIVKASAERDFARFFAARLKRALATAK